MQKIQKVVVGISAFVGSMSMALAAPCGSTGLPTCHVPEPSSLPLLGLGLVGAILVARFFKT